MEELFILHWLYSDLDEIIDFDYDKDVMSKTQIKENTDEGKQIFEAYSDIE